MAFGIGKDKSSSESQQSTFVDPAQQAFLNNVRGQGQQTFNRVNPQLQGAAERGGQEARNVNRELTGRQRQIAGGSNPFIQNLLQRTSGDNPFLQSQVDALGVDVSRFTGEAIGQIGQGFASANQFGGSRQGLAEGVAIGRGAEEFAQGAAQLRGDDLLNQTAAATAGAGLQLDASIAGQAGAAAQFELAIAPLLAQFGGVEALSGIIGDPTVIGSGTSSSKSLSLQAGGS